MIVAPDERLRVFVSAAPGELDAEREAAVTAIKGLLLTPVAFDGTSQPLPAPDRYRASVAHCNVFVGIYGDGDPPVISVEEELRLAAQMPRLVYVKLTGDNTAPQVAARVAEAAGGSLSYKPFALADQLKDLIAGDLALLLTEGFAVAARPESPRDEEFEDHSNLPVMTDSFAGRERELEALRGLLGSSTVRLITLTGPGGIGKTRLAIEAGTAASSDFEIVRLVHCEAATDTAAAVDLIGRTVGLAGSETGIESLAARLASTRTLLLLDNLEQLLPDFAVTVAQLLEDCTSLHVLATSRAPLRIRAEHEFFVDPLDVPLPDAAAEQIRASGAVQLYLDRAAARGVDASGDIATVARLCAKLDGVPLAIELAAARAQILSTAAILQRLDHALDLLRTSAPDVPARQRTIRAAIEWSFALLTDEERDVILRLAVFEGGASLSAAQDVAGKHAGTSSLDVLTSLVEKNLVRTTQDVEPRLTMFQTVREFAFERLDSEASQAVRGDHAGYFLDTAGAAAEGLRGPEQALWLERIGADDANITAAIRWAVAHGPAEDAAHAMSAIWPYLWVRWPLLQTRELGEAVVAAAPATFWRERTRTFLALVTFSTGDLDGARRLVAEAGAALADSGDAVGINECELIQAVLAMFAGEAERAATLFERFEASFSRTRDLHTLVMSLNARTWLAAWAGVGDLDDAFYARGVDEARRLGSLSELGTALNNRALYEFQRGRRAVAFALWFEVIDVCRRLHTFSHVSYLLDGVAEVAVAANESETAAALLAASAAQRRTIGTSLVFSHHHDALVAKVRAAADPAVFEQATTDGAVLNMSAALELASRTLHAAA